MADVKWIKIVTDIFSDEKIRFIETMPNGEQVIVIWFKLICLGGKSNSNGFLMMTEKIAYTDEMLASIFNRNVKVIQSALMVFEKLAMIEIINNKIYLTNWEKHQNAEKLETIREQTKLRVKKHRDKLLCNANTVTEVLQDRYGNATEEDIRIKNKENIKEKPLSLLLGEFKNISLTEEERNKLYERFDKFITDKAIEQMSNYCKANGKKYKDYYAALLNWIKRNEKPQGVTREL